MTTMLIKEIDISMLMIHGQQINEKKFKESDRQTMRYWKDYVHYSYKKLEEASMILVLSKIFKHGPSFASALLLNLSRISD